MLCSVLSYRNYLHGRFEACTSHLRSTYVPCAFALNEKSIKKEAKSRILFVFAVEIPSKLNVFSLFISLFSQDSKGLLRSKHGHNLYVTGTGHVPPAYQVPV